MILTTIKLHARSEKRKEILQTVNGLSSLMLSRSGCLGVNLYLDVDDRDIVYVLERWLSKKDLERYRKSKSFSILLGLETLLVSSPEINDVNCCTEHTTSNSGDIAQTGHH